MSLTAVLALGVCVCTSWATAHRAILNARAACVKPPESTSLEQALLQAGCPSWKTTPSKTHRGGPDLTPDSDTNWSTYCHLRGSSGELIGWECRKGVIRERGLRHQTRNPSPL